MAPSCVRVDVNGWQTEQIHALLVVALYFKDSLGNMGKAKNNKFKRPQFTSAGLPAVKHAAREEEEEEEEEDSCPAGELLEKVGTQHYRPACMYMKCADLTVC